MNREEAIANLNMISVAFVDPVTKEQRKLIDDTFDMAIKALEQEPCGNAIDRAEAIKIASGYCHPANVAKELAKLPPVNPTKTGHWIPVSERLPELNRPLLVTTYHRVYYGHLISESGNYGYPVFRIHGLGDKNRDWVQETISHEPYSLGRIDAWMYLDIPEPYKVEPQESEDKDADKKCTYKETGCGSCKRQLDCPIEAERSGEE